MKANPWLYAASIPERTIRSLSAVGGGMLREVGELSLPPNVRELALYRATAGIGLRFMIQQLGDVRGVYPRTDALSRKFALRYAVGTSIEAASILTWYVSPVWVLAALGDATRVGRGLVTRIGDALKAEQLLDAKVSYQTMDQLLAGLDRTSTHLALTVNMPPLEVRLMRQEWLAFRTNLASLPPVPLPTPEELERAWDDLRRAAQRLNHSVLWVSAALGISALSSIPRNLWLLSRSVGVAAQTTGSVVGRPFLEHYSAASKKMAEQGIGSWCGEHLRPYRLAAIRNFLPEKRSWTEKVLSRIV